MGAPVFALTETEEMGHLKTTVYAPDWIWQKNAVNILVVLDNEGSQPADCTVELIFPESHSDHFKYETDLEKSVSIHIPPRTTLRHAFTNIEALAGVDLQTYPFQFRITKGTQTRIIEYPLTTIRGPLVSSARWALYLPAFICIACCLLFVVAGKKFAQPRAWRTPSEPIPEPNELEDWVNQIP
jgi:hypothetical protein